MKKLLTIMGVALLTAFVSGCGKSGCTDANAVNFESGAKKDDGSCTYKGNVVFWYGKTTAASLAAIGSTALTYYVDSKLVGSGAASVYWTGAPECSQAQSVTITEDLGIAKNKTYSYSIKDQDGDEIWTGVVNFTANTCLKMELTY
ncbi:MAG: hypothetical protein WCK82_01040 [Bacteroidota bacterium]